MLIGELAQRAGTSTRTPRYYEEHGLLRADRAANGYRTYDEAELRVVTEIRCRPRSPSPSSAASARARTSRRASRRSRAERDR